jgi:hypothetical protein
MQCLSPSTPAQPSMFRAPRCSSPPGQTHPPPLLHFISAYAPGLAFLPDVLYIWFAYTPSFVSLLTPLSVQFYLLVHCTENPIYVFPEMKLRGLVTNSYIYVSESDLYIPRIILPIWLQRNRQSRSWEYLPRSQIHECGNWETRN